MALNSHCEKSSTFVDLLCPNHCPPAHRTSPSSGYSTAASRTPARIAVKTTMRSYRANESTRCLVAPQTANQSYNFCQQQTLHFCVAPTLHIASDKQRQKIRSIYFKVGEGENWSPPSKHAGVRQTYKRGVAGASYPKGDEPMRLIYFHFYLLFFYKNKTSVFVYIDTNQNKTLVGHPLNQNHENICICLKVTRTRQYDKRLTGRVKNVLK